MTNVIEQFFTIDREFGPTEFKEKGSRFLGLLFPVKTKEIADDIIAGLRKKYYDSTHVVFAYRLGNGKETYFRYSDDGEPSGTGGLPVYNEIKSKQYFNVLVAVVRYYGGTKLGTGGLARAYGQGGKDVLAIAKTVTVHIKQKVSVSFPFDFTGEMMQVVNRFNLEITKQDYDAKGSVFLLDVPIAKVEEVRQQITDRSNGQIEAQVVDN